VRAAIAQCGTPTKKDDGIAATTDTASVTYQIGAFNPLVIVENGSGAVAATASVTASSQGPIGGNYLACVNNACKSVAGSGVNHCATDADCGSVSNGGSGETHAVCGVNACVNVQGSGQDTCSTDVACGGSGTTHLACEGNSCLVVWGSGSDQCTTPGLTCGSNPANPNGPPSPVTIVSFIPTPATTIVPPEKVTLTWTSSGASSCTMDQGIDTGGLTNGSVIVSPSATTTYTLTCTGAGGEDSKSITVTVGGAGQKEIPPS
jgi:hypothetical protein